MIKRNATLTWAFSVRADSTPHHALDLQNDRYADVKLESSMKFAAR